MTNETAAPGCIEINTLKTSVARPIILIVHANIKYFVAKVQYKKTKIQRA